MNTHTAEQLARDHGRDQDAGGEPVARGEDTQVHVTDSRKDTRADKEASPALPHERDTQSSDQRRAFDPQMEQARRDIESGQIDTDLRNTPGLDAPERERKVPRTGGGGSR